VELKKSFNYETHEKYQKRYDLTGNFRINATGSGGFSMQHVVNVEDLKPDQDERSLRHAVKGRTSQILRDTYYLVDPENSASKNLTMGYTVIYPTGKTTGHAHPEMEEVYYILSGKGTMVIGEEEFPIESGDAFHVPFGRYHVTYNTGNQPLAMIWVTGKDESAGK